MEELAPRFRPLPDSEKDASSDTGISELPNKQSPQFSSSKLTQFRAAIPFSPKRELARGAIHSVQAALGFAFMLAVM
jgi:hypothetical protein